MSWEQTITDLKMLLTSKSNDIKRSAICSLGKIAYQTNIPEEVVIEIANCLKGENKNINWEADKTLKIICNTQGFTLADFQKLIDLLEEINAGDWSANLLGSAYHDTPEGEPPAIPAEIMNQLNQLILEYTSWACGNAVLSLGYMAMNNLTLTQAQIDAISGILDSEQAINPNTIASLKALGKLDFRHPEPSEHTLQRLLELTKDSDPLIQKAASDTIGLIAERGKQTLP